PAGAVAVLLRRDELVDVLEPLVVAHVGRHAAVGADEDVRALVLEPPQCRALTWGRCRVERVELDDPAEPVRLVGLGGEVDAFIDAIPPALGAALGAQPVAAVPPGAFLVGDVGARTEVLVDVLFSGQDRAPRCQAAGAVVEHAVDRGAVRVGRGAHEVAASDRTGQVELGAGVDAAVVPARATRAPPFAGVADPLDLENGAAVRRHRDPQLFLGG